MSFHFQTELDKIMDNFDFDRVHRVMDAIDWKWADINDVPVQSELRQTAGRLLHDAHQFGSTSGIECSVATGGFHALFDPKEDYLSLRFQVAEWSNIDG